MTTAAKPRSDASWAQACEAFLKTGGPARLLETRTALAESMVRDAWGEHLAPAAPEALAVLAVGGFGRRQLFPHSDVDILLLVEKEALAQAVKQALSAFLQDLWDRGLRLSHSVRTLSDCCELHDQNLELNISLLDQRFLAGARPLADKLSPRLARFFHGRRDDLARRLCWLARGRHAKFGGTIYHLEPDIKEAPGGLRDLHLMVWLSLLRNADRERLPDPEPSPELDAARDFLFTLRCWMHLNAGRDANVLTFDLQEEAAVQPFALARDPAGLMREYYRHARELHNAAARAMETAEGSTSSLFVQFRDWRSRIANAEFNVLRERVYFRSPHLLDWDPEVALRLFLFVARHGFRLAVETERRIGERLSRLSDYFATPRPVWPALDELLRLPHSPLALRAMASAGVLPAVFPEWRAIECLVVRDFYHRYTVDEHTLVALQALANLRSEHDPARQRFAVLLSELEEPGLLMFALLFHDAGKTTGFANHVAESVRLAELAMERIAVPEEKRRTVRFLIERHLELSSIMNTRDLEEPATARFIAERAATIELLKGLTLLTYADISAVNPTALTPWRMEQLWRVYLLGYNELTRELETERIQAPAASPELAGFLEGFPTRYLRTHTEPQVQVHFNLEQRSRERGVALELEKLDGVHKLTLVTADRPFLLASIAGALAAFGMNILKAEGFANRHGVVLDTFVFADPARTLELNPSETDRLRITLERVALGKIDVRQLLERRPRPKPPSRGARLSPTVSFDSAASDSATLVQIVAEDRPGLLYDVASTLSAAGCNIELILIDTEAHKALDVFYITRHGHKLAEAEQPALRDSLLKAITQI